MANLRKAAKDISTALEQGEELERFDPTDDSFDAEGSVFRSGPVVNTPVQSFLEVSDDELAATLAGDEGALEYVSTKPPYANGPRDDGSATGAARENAIRQAAQAQATLRNPTARQKLDPAQAGLLKGVVDAMQDLPAPDVTTWVGDRRITVPGEVITVPNRLQKKQSLELLQKLLGGECAGNKRNAAGAVECRCLTHRVVMSAQAFGFRDKPCVWLSQHLFQESHRRDVRNEIPRKEITAFDIVNDGSPTAPIPRAIATLFSYENAESLMQLADARGRSVIDVLRLLCANICDKAEAIKRPHEYSEQFDT